MGFLFVLKISSTIYVGNLGIYRAASGDILAIERLAARTLHMRNLTERNIIGGDLNLRQED
jgi:hypothetical protein